MSLEFVMGLLVAGVPLGILAVAGFVDSRRGHRRVLWGIRQHGKTVREWIRFSRQIGDHQTAIKCVMAAEAAAWRYFRESQGIDESKPIQEEMEWKECPAGVHGGQNPDCLCRNVDGEG